MRETVRMYGGKNLLDISEDKQQPIVQDFLYENDYVLLVAKEKVGKTLLGLQLACSLTTGTPFLDILEIPKPVNVWYIAAEGKDTDVRMRLVNISKQIPIDVTKMRLFCTTFLILNKEIGIKTLEKMLDDNPDCVPKVIIIDPLYITVDGSLKDDQVVNSFMRTITWLSHRCNASIMVFHHAKRAIKLKDGSTTETSSDEDIFGSAFLKAGADNVFYMGNIPHTNHKFLRCDTQREATVIERLEFKLIQPSPLYFELVHATEHIPRTAERIKDLLRHKDGLTMDEIRNTLGVSRQWILAGFKHLKIEKSKGRRPVYKISEDS